MLASRFSFSLRAEPAKKSHRSRYHISSTSYAARRRKALVSVLSMPSMLESHVDWPWPVVDGVLLITTHPSFFIMELQAVVTSSSQSGYSALRSLRFTGGSGSYLRIVVRYYAMLNCTEKIQRLIAQRMVAVAIASQRLL